MIQQRIVYLSLHGDATSWTTSSKKCHLLNTLRTVPNSQLCPIIYRESFLRNMLWNPTNNYSIAGPWLLSRGSCSGVCIFHETITTISLWHHSSSCWDNAVSIGANAVAKTMVFMFKCVQHYHGRKSKGYGYHIRQTKGFRYADHIGCIRVNFMPCAMDKDNYIPLNL